MDEVPKRSPPEPGWTVQHEDNALGFFSFAKFLMFRDLDPAIWPARARLSEQPLIRGCSPTGSTAPKG
jgi:hypothetical protein